MANNDTTRASAPLTARAKAKRTAEIRRILEAECAARQDAKGGESASLFDLPVPKIPAEPPRLQDAPIPVEPPALPGLSESLSSLRSILSQEPLPGPRWDFDEEYIPRLRDAVAAAIPFIKEFEQFRDKAYWDEKGKKWTVGHGLTQIPDPVTKKMRDVVEGDTIAEKDSDALVRRIALSRAASLYKDVAWARKLGTGALAASIELAYNAGAGIFNADNSPILNKAMSAATKDHDAILYAALPSYSRSGGVLVDGLLNRREAAISHFRDGMLIADARRKAEAARAAERKAKKAAQKKAKGVRQDAKGGRTLRAGEGGGDAGPGPSSVPTGGTPVGQGGPRIVINPKVFSDRRDALCVAFNERFRIWMEGTGYRPGSEPTRRQREFFSDTAYAEDETMLRRTILARIATLDTSVKDPTEAQVADTLDMLHGFRETEKPDDAWQAEALDRIIGYVEGLVPSQVQSSEPSPEPSEPPAESSS